MKDTVVRCERRVGYHGRATGDGQRDRCRVRTYADVLVDGPPRQLPKIGLISGIRKKVASQNVPWGGARGFFAWSSISREWNEGG
jgi:hypothetical protein